MASGLVVTRTWRLTGENGDQFIASMEMTTRPRRPLTDSVIEVIPKLLVASIVERQVRRGDAHVVNPDPIVRFDVTLAPGKQRARGLQHHGAAAMVSIRTGSRSGRPRGTPSRPRSTCCSPFRCRRGSSRTVRSGSTRDAAGL